MTQISSFIVRVKPDQMLNRIEHLDVIEDGKQHRQKFIYERSYVDEFRLGALNYTIRVKYRRAR